MGWRQKKWDEKEIARRVRLCMGAGERESYKSWLEFRDFSSKGTTSRTYFPELGRVVLSFSNLELAAALFAVRRRNFYDLKDQFPLSRDLTRAIARSLGIRHPRYRGTRIESVMTVDLLLTQTAGGETWHEVYDCKWSTYAQKARHEEIRSIVKAYCEKEGWKYFLITEETFPKNMMNNLEWIRMAMPGLGEQEPFVGAFDIWPTRMYMALQDEVRKQPDTRVHEFCTAFEKANGLLPAFGLRLMKQLMNYRLVDFPLTELRPSFLELRELDIAAQPPCGLDFMGPMTSADGHFDASYV